MNEGWGKVMVPTIFYVEAPTVMEGRTASPQMLKDFWLNSFG